MAAESSEIMELANQLDEMIATDTSGEILDHRARKKFRALLRLLNAKYRKERATIRALRFIDSFSKRAHKVARAAVDTGGQRGTSRRLKSIQKKLSLAFTLRQVNLALADRIEQVPVLLAKAGVMEMIWGFEVGPRVKATVHNEKLEQTKARIAQLRLDLENVKTKHSNLEEQLSMSKKHVADHKTLAMKRTQHSQLKEPFAHEPKALEKAEELNTVDHQRQLSDDVAAPLQALDVNGGPGMMNNEPQANDNNPKPQVKKVTRTLKCPHCQKTCATAGLLKRHKRTHMAGQRSFVCPVCSNKFTKKSNLKTHEKRHAKDKRFVCDVCAHAFVDKCNIQTHVLTHSGVKPHTCPICDKAFARMSYLKAHMSTHCGPAMKLGAKTSLKF